MAEAPARIHAAPVAGFPALPLRDDPPPELFCFLRQDAEFDALRARLAAWHEAGAIDEDAEDELGHAWRVFVASEATPDGPDLDALRREVLRPGADVQEALVELAAAGDADARRAMAEVRRRKLYGWVDMNSSVQLAEGLDLGLAPYWIDERETISCRRNGVARVVGGLIG